MISLTSLIRTLLLLCFGLSAIYACITTLRVLRKFRAERKYTNELLTWAVRPYEGFKYELDTWVAINIHRLALFSAGLAGLYLLFFRPVTGIVIPGIPGSIAGLIAFPILAGCVAGMGFFWGQAFFGPLAEYLAGNSHYALSEEGVLTGGQLFPWTAFSHFSLTVEGTVIRLWSASFPGAVAFTLIPPVEHVSKLRSILESHLPGEGIASPGLIRRSAFPAIMSVVLILSIIIAIAAATFSSGLAIVIITIIMYLLVLFGGKVIMRWIYGNQNQPASIE
jgi:hypothetical protein